MRKTMANEATLNLFAITYFTRSSSDARIIGADLGIVNIFPDARVHFLAILLIGYVNGSSLQGSGSGSVRL